MYDYSVYCIDIIEHKSKARINKGSQAHTYYSYQGKIAVDQDFYPVKLTNNEFFLPAFDVCMDAASFTASATLRLNKCQDLKLRKFKLDDKGGIHLTKSLSWQFCSDTLEPFQMWNIRTIE